MSNRDRFEGSQPEAALAKLMTGYMPYIQKRASRVRVAGLEKDDLVQEGLMGLFRAIQTFDETQGASFSTYAITCINNGIATAVKQAMRKKHLPLTEYLPLPDEGNGAVGADSPEDLTIAGEDYAALLHKINDELTKLERDVLALYLKGYDYVAAAKRLDTTPKSVDNALQRARRKLKSGQ